MQTQGVKKEADIYYRNILENFHLNPILIVKIFKKYLTAFNY